VIRSSIFAKIFLWFWAALILVAGSVIMITVLSGSQPLGQRWLARSLDLYGATAVDLYIHGGQPALEKYLDSIERSVGIHATLLDPSENDILGRGIPPDARRAYDAARVAGKSRFYTRLHWTGASLISTPSGYYYFVAEVHPVRGLFAEPSFRAAVLKLVAAIVAAGFLSFWLARHFAKPIRALQSAANQLAEGDLSVRAGPSLANRQDELSDLAQDFDRMAARIQSLVRTQQEMLGDISHELRSPLTRMNVALELARRGDTSGLIRAQAEIEKLESLIAQILTLTRIDLRKGQKLDQPIELRLLLESIVQDANFEGAAQQKTVAISAVAGCHVLGDAGLLRSCIENVIRNAIRYTPENSTVAVGLQTVGNGADISAQVCVRDHGPGVPVESLPKIFEPFFRVSESRDRDSGGSGLGLAIAQRVATLHGGSIQVQNASSGLLVTITLPATKTPPVK
jgi:two-component system sensor histidine kinase CpxA